jgi:hypothetical protein
MVVGVLYGMVLYYFYLRNMRKLERRIGWLEMMLRAVKSHAEDMRKASIDENLQLRMDTLGTDERTTKAPKAPQTRLAVIMHRIWVDGTEFRWTREVAAA